jgi:hypothetical protein
MQLRHISPGSSDWMDAVDEEAGGRGWEKLAPEERVKLLRERRQAAGSTDGSGHTAVLGSGSVGSAHGLALTSPSR